MMLFFCGANGEGQDFSRSDANKKFAQVKFVLITYVIGTACTALSGFVT